MAIAMSLVPNVYWTHEGNELAWDDPVEVTVLHLFVVLVLLHVEGLE